MSRTIDQAGLDLVVRSLKTGANKPGEAGTDVLAGNTFGDVLDPGDEPGAVSGVAKVLEIVVGGVTYYIPLFDDNTTT